MTKQEFIERIAAYVQKYAYVYGIMVHSPIIAQAILESGWGESKLSSQYHNYFGLKCGTKWTGKSVNMKTKEEYTEGNLTTIRDNFRVFDSMEEGVKGYFEFIQLARYSNLKGITDPETYLKTIKSDGYATSSTYVENNMKLVRQYNLTQYDEKEGTNMTETEQRKAVVNWLKQYKGISEGSTQHKSILKVFNDSGLCKRYKMTVNDAWCATAVSAAFIANGLGSIFPVECSCWYIIKYAKERGIWVENDAYVPKVGDAVLYDWQDSGAGDNQGNPDHIGLVQSISGNTMKIVEGNMNNTVDVRSLQVNGRYIRGYVTPKYTGTKEEIKETNPTPTTPKTVKSVKATKSAASFKKSIAGSYKTTDDLNMRNGAGTGNKILTTLKAGVIVKNYGYYTTVAGTKWLYVQVTVDNVKYTGFCSGKYLKKV